MEWRPETRHHTRIRRYLISVEQPCRTALYEAANIILTRPVKGSQLKSWAAKVAQRSGMKKAKVALARKLSVVMHRMLVDGTCFDPALAAA